MHIHVYMDLNNYASGCGHRECLLNTSTKYMIQGVLIWQKEAKKDQF